MRATSTYVGWGLFLNSFILMADNIISTDVGTVSALLFFIMAKIKDHAWQRLKVKFAVITGAVEARLT